MMIITVTLNAALDKTLEVPNFTPGRRHRTVDQKTMPGGKGVNIARAIKRLGQPVIATGLAGGATGSRIVEALNDEAILNSFVRIREESRTNTAVLDPTTGLHTEINERGPSVSPRELELCKEKLMYLARGASICVFAGSLPRGVEPDVYASLIRSVRKLGVVTIIDTDGEPLHQAVRAEPDVVSPNELEAEELVGHEFNEVDDRAQAVAEIARLGPAEAIMTVADGCYAHVMVDGAPALYRIRIEPLEARSPIGSGDAFLAGYVASRYAGKEPVDCLRFGVACGAESTQHIGAGILEPAKVDRLLEGIQVERLSLPAQVS
jgi:1-phosphofructokinase/tagatose 6-phosphate kinase